MKALLRSALVQLLWLSASRKVAREGPTIITVTGSVGKTSTKEAIALVLESSGRSVLKTWGGLNTEIGVPLSLLGFKETPQGLWGLLKLVGRIIRPPKGQSGGYYVLEYSADKPGDIAFLTRKLPGQVRIITKIAPSHMGAYTSFDDLVKEKLSLLSNMREGDVAVLNADDPEQKKGAPSDHVLWYGCSKTSKAAGVWGREVKLTPKGLECSIAFIAKPHMDGIGRSRGKSQSITVQTQLIGNHQLYGLLAAAAIGFQQGLRPEQMKEQLERYQLPAGRGRLLEGVKDMTIIDDSYNASPESVKAGLKMLRPFAGNRRVVAILGNMNELGSLAKSAHQEVATTAASLVDYLIAIGPEGSSMVKAAVAAGMPAHQVIRFGKPEQALHKVDQLLKKGDVVYVKGSQNNVRLERLVERIMAHPSQADKLLVRQSSYWKKKL